MTPQEELMLLDRIWKLVGYWNASRNTSRHHPLLRQLYFRLERRREHLRRGPYDD